MQKPGPTIAVLFAGALGVGTAAPAQEKTGTSVSDQAVVYAMFEIHNPTAHAISYEVRWGNGAWKPVRIMRGESYEHSYKLNAKGEFFAPHIRFDRILNRIDGSPSYKVYKLDTNRVVRGGFGPGGNTGTPRPYHFDVSDRRMVELYEK
jgi:hypothetical protein